MRPCTCERCHLCWLYHHDPRYRALWDGRPAPRRQSLPERVAAFFGAVAGHVRRGRPLVTDEVFEQRITTCRACTEYDRDRDRCGLCGCAMTRKARWADQECPGKFWLAVVS